MNQGSSEGNPRGNGCLGLIALVFAIGGPIMLVKAIIDPSTMPDSSGPLEKIGLWLLVAMIVLASWMALPSLLSSLIRTTRAANEAPQVEKPTSPPSTEDPSPSTDRPAKPRRKTIPRSVQMYVWQRDGGRCVECGSNENLEYDHIIPHSKGGSDSDRNLQLMCRPCNRSKGAKIGGSL